jgi:alpha-amylase
VTEAPPRLCLVVHFHQPVGNLDEVVRHAAQACYRPFLDIIGRHPGIPWTLHYSGCLLRWLEGNEPDIVAALRALVDQGVVELMGGGMEEPILASIPEGDRQRQIARLREHLVEVYGSSPKGLWLTERVWEPELAATLSRAGIHHTVVDDTSLRAVGVPQGLEAGPWVTDHLGEATRLLGASRSLRYLIPYARPEAILAEVDKLGPGGLAVYADDGEKFGEWPDTNEQVYGRGWLDRLLSALEAGAARGRLEVAFLSQGASLPPRGRVYLPSCSYDEMMTWALPTPARSRLEQALAGLEGSRLEPAADFLRGAPWQGFLAKYPEASRLHQEMLRVSREVERAGSPENAVEHLHMAQCNCAYWHGTFGGAYLTFLRLALWHHLVAADLVAARTLGEAPRTGLDVADLDSDGWEEVRLWAPWGYATVAPRRRGQLVDLISFAGEANLVAVMGRHQEAYHLEPAPRPRASADLELGVLTAPTGASPDRLEFDTDETGALADSIDGKACDGDYSWEPLQTGVRLAWSGRGLRLEKELRATGLGLEVTYSLRPLAGDWQGTLQVEVRSCPYAEGATADSVTCTEVGGRWRVDQPQSSASLEIATDPAAPPAVTAVVTRAATLKGWEELPQGLSLRWTWDLKASQRSPAQVRMLLVPTARTA